MENTGIHKIKGENKRVFKSMKCPECPFHNKCAKNSKYRVFYESHHPLILEMRKNFIAAVELFLYKYRGIFVINRTKNLVLKLNKTQIIINQKIKKLINGQTHNNF